MNQCMRKYKDSGLMKMFKVHSKVQVTMAPVYRDA